MKARFVIDASEAKAVIGGLVDRLPTPYQDADNLIFLFKYLFVQGVCDFTVGPGFTAPETGDHILPLRFNRDFKDEALALVASDGDVLFADPNRESRFCHDAILKSSEEGGQT